MNVPFLDLARQYLPIKNEIDGAVHRVMDRQMFILGEELSSFETEFARYLGAGHSVGVGSGTEGLILALRALGIGKGDEVITPANSFIATTLSITETGATPVFVDVDPDTYEMNVGQIESKITGKTKAILPVHLYGCPCDIGRILDIAKKKKLFVIEDACQSSGSAFQGKKTGTFGDIGVFSFYPGKNLGAYGDGGAICTDSETIYNKLLKLRNYGQTKKYFHSEIGVNSRLDEMQAAVLRVKLPNLDGWNEKRNRVAGKYNQLLSGVKTQKILPGCVSNYHVFTIEVDDRDEAQKKLASQGINTLIHYPIPIHLQECYRYLNYKPGDLPVSEKLSKRLLSLPIFSELTDGEIQYVCDQVNRVISGS
jgi:dTDP-4-amino-4,6-dideoxygalactose transaminase